MTGSPFVSGGFCSGDVCADGTSVMNFKISWFLVYTLYIRRPPAARALSQPPGGGGALLRLDHRIPGGQKGVATCQSLLGQRYAPVSAVWGSPPSPHARSGPNANGQLGIPQAARPGSSQHKNEKAEVRGARSHSRHWKPGARRPLVPTAWLSPLHSRPVQTHQATTAAELRRGRRRAEMSNTISTSYINIALCSRVTPFGRRGLSAPSSRFFDGSATRFRRLCRPASTECMCVRVGRPCL